MSKQIALVGHIHKGRKIEMTEEEIKEWFDKWSDRHTLIEIVWGKKQSKKNTIQ